MNREENAEDAKATVTVTREPPGGRSFIRHDARHLMLPVGPSVNFHTFKERGDLSHESPGSRSVLGVCRHHARRPHMVLAGGRPRPGWGAGQMGGGGGGVYRGDQMCGEGGLKADLDSASRSQEPAACPPAQPVTRGRRVWAPRPRGKAAWLGPHSRGDGCVPVGG